MDGLIAHLERVRTAVVDQESAPSPTPEFYGPYIDAPLWPWLLAGWALGSAIVLLFVLAWARS